MKKINDVIAYIQGNIRYKLYYSKLCFLIPEYVREQIMARILSMNSKCFTQGSCIKCGCRTTHLQMANKACNGNCYPIMVDVYMWDYMKEGNITFIKGNLWKLENDKFKVIVK